MPVFELQDPSGKVYEVEAPDQQSAIAGFQQYSAQDTSPKKVTSFGSREEQLGNFAEKHPIASKAASFLSGVPFVGSYADEAIGSVMGALGPNDAQTNTDAIRAMLKREEEQNPKTTMGLKLAGGITGAIPMAMAAAPAVAGMMPAAMGGKMAVGGGLAAVSGGLEGGVSGYGRGVEPKSRKESAMMDGAIGTGLGAGLGVIAAPLSAGIKSGARSVLDAMNVSKNAKRVGLSKPSVDIVSRAMNADGSFAGSGAQRLQQAGPEAMLADAGPNARTLLDTAIQKSGPSGNVARQAIEQRAANANQTIGTALDNTFGAPQGVRSSARDIASSSAPARSQAYEAAYSKPIEYGDPQSAGAAIEGVLKRIPNRTLKSAIETANEAMQAAGVKNKQILADIADDGAVTFREMPNVQQLDEIKKALGEVAASEVDQFGRKTGSGVRSANLARELRDAISKAVPEYGQAVKLGGDKIAEDQALALGTKLFRPGTTREMVIEGMEGATEAEIAALSKGIRSQFDEGLANVKRAVSDGNMDAREAIKAVRDMSSRANREKLATAIGQQKADVLFAEFDRAAMALDLRASVADNSKTFARTSMDDTIKAQTEGSAFQALKSGEPLNAGKRIVQALTGSTPDAKMKVGDKIYSEIVDVLTRTRGPQAQQTLRDLANITKASASNEELAKIISRRLTSGALLPAYHTGNQLAAGR